MLFEMSDVSCIVSVKFIRSVQVFNAGMRKKLVCVCLFVFPKKTLEIA